MPAALPPPSGRPWMQTFYDLTGSGGKAGLAAVFFHNWSSVVSLESCRQKFVSKHVAESRLKLCPVHV